MAAHALPEPSRRGSWRYEWACPGGSIAHGRQALPTFRRPGHAITSDRTKTREQRVNPPGHDYFHAVVDDHTRLAYGEPLAGERAETVTAFAQRAGVVGLGIPCRRLMADGAWAYTRNRGLREPLSHQSDACRAMDRQIADAPVRSGPGCTTCGRQLT
jgi:hypothetical protein